MESLERLRAVYCALGPGFPADALELFSGSPMSNEDFWCFTKHGKALTLSERR